MDVVSTDLLTLLMAAPHIIERGGAYYAKNKEFYERCKNGEAPSLVEVRKLLTSSVLGYRTSRDFRKKVICTVKASYEIEHLLKGEVWDAPFANLLAYWSMKNPSSVVVQPASRNWFLPDLMAGHAFHNCLNITKVLEYKMQRDARVDFLWHNGLRVGVAYGAIIRGHDDSRRYLLDSIEFSDTSYAQLGRVSQMPTQRALETVIDGYVKLRLRSSKHGIFIGTHSNDDRVIEALKNCAVRYQGRRLTSSLPLNVQTDTGITRMPYLLPK
jgi:hypothetical protein